jgi:DNA-binding response OmpR family regulator
VVAYCSDLSKGGMFVGSALLLPVDSPVRVTLELPEGAGDIPVFCRVAWSRDGAQSAREGKPCGMGLEFQDVPEDTLMLLEAFISERMSADADKVSPIRAEKRLSVLVVDDDPGYQKTAAAPFRARGDYVRIAGDGMDALAMCLKEPPDIILSDVQMPRMDGWQLLRLVRSRPQLQTVPIIFLTTLSGEEERLRGYQLGVDDFVAKPYRSIELRARVDRLTARARAAARKEEKNSLRGDLAQVSLPSLFTFLELERKTGRLAVLGEKSGYVWVRDGRPLRVEIEDAEPYLSQSEMMTALLDWRDGQFDFSSEPVEGDDKLSTSFTALLLEHARVSDERSR